jgi:hypothetical protein
LAYPVYQAANDLAAEICTAAGFFNSPLQVAGRGWAELSLLAKMNVDPELY